MLNKTLKSVASGVINKGAQEIKLAVATKTERWTRPEAVALQQASLMKKVVSENLELIKDGTTSIELR